MNRFYQPYKLSILQRASLIPYFGIKALRCPENGVYIAGLGDVTALPSLRNLRTKLLATEEGRDLLLRKPMINESSLNMEQLRKLPKGTMGRGYAAYMDGHGFSADGRPNVRFMLSEDLAYIMARYRQVHDFWHVLSGLPPTLLGEVALKCFEHQVTGLPSCALGGVLGQVKLSGEERSLLHREYIPWAVRAARRCERDLLAYDYEGGLQRDLDEVRRELNFEVPPPLAQ